MKPHKHAELIKAWADGQAEVEYRYPKDDGSWSLWKDLTQCVFHDWYEYRIKPEPKPLSDEEIKIIATQNRTDLTIPAYISFARAIEERHGIK